MSLTVPRSVLFSLLAAILMLVSQSNAAAGTILSFGIGNTDGGNAQDPGLSLLTPTGGPWNDITFNFYQNSEAGSPGAPYALGKLFLLDQVYSGKPQDLSASTTGFLAQASGDGSVYAFDNSVTLLPNTTYFFYADLGLPNGDLTYVSDFSGGDLTTNQTYGAPNGNGNFLKFPWDINFSLNGNVVAVPEPSSFAMLAVAGIAMCLVRRRKL